MRRRILAWVEDDPFEQALIRAAVTAQEDGMGLYLAPSGDDLLAAMQIDHPHALRPDIVFVNLETNEPLGVEVVRQMKADPTLRRIPVIGYARQGERELVWEAYGAGVNACLLKPSTYSDLRRVVHGTLHFWLSAARLPAPPLRAPLYPSKPRAATGTYGRF